MVEDDLVQRHGDRLGRLEAHRGGALLLVLDLGNLHLANDDLLVGDAEAHSLGQPLGLEEVPERVRERGHVGHLAVTDDAGGELHARGAGDPIGGGLDSGDERAVEIQSDRATVGRFAESEGHLGS